MHTLDRRDCYHIATTRTNRPAARRRVDAAPRSAPRATRPRPCRRTGRSEAAARHSGRAARSVDPVVTVQVGSYVSGVIQTL